MFSDLELQKIARSGVGPTERSIVEAASGLKNKALGVISKPTNEAAVSANSIGSKVDDAITGLENFKNKKVNDAAVAYSKKRLGDAVDSVSNTSPRTVRNAVSNFVDDVTGKKTRNLEYKLDDAIYSRDAQQAAIEDARSRYVAGKDGQVGLDDYEMPNKTLFSRADEFIRRQNGEASPLENARMDSNLAGIDMATAIGKRTLSDADILALKGQIAQSRINQDRAIKRVGYTIGGAAGLYGGYKADQALEKRRLDKEEQKKIEEDRRMSDQRKVASFSIDDLEKIAGVGELYDLAAKKVGNKLIKASDNMGGASDTGVELLQVGADTISRRFADSPIAKAIGVDEALTSGMGAARKAKNSLGAGVVDAVESKSNAAREGLERGVANAKMSAKDSLLGTHTNPTPLKGNRLDSLSGGDVSYASALGEEAKIPNISSDPAKTGLPAKKMVLGAGVAGGTGLAGGALLSNGRDKRASMSLNDIEKIAISLGTLKGAGTAAKTLTKQFGDDAVKGAKSFASKSVTKSADAGHLMKETASMAGKKTKGIADKALAGVKKPFKAVGDYGNNVTGKTVKKMKSQTYMEPKDFAKVNKSFAKASDDMVKARVGTGVVAGGAAAGHIIGKAGDKNKNKY